MDFLPSKINQYVESRTEVEPPLLAKIRRETNLEVLLPRMLSGHLQGRVLSMFSKMVRPKRILEIGTYTGYATICLAEGVTEDGKIYTIDKNEELETRVKEYFKEAHLENKVNFQIGEALDLLPKILEEEQFDLVFLDADKENYSNYYQLCVKNLRVGGFIIADNVLWSGKVLQESQDTDTEALKKFNDLVHADNRVSNVLFPIRDGLMVLQKTNNS